MDEARILELDADALEAEIRRHNNLYWLQAAPEIPDTLFDAMVERLRTLRPDSEVLGQIGADASDQVPASKKVVHEHPMLSLDKCYTEAELLAWFARFEGRAVASHKIDGVAISIRYGQGGELILGATRGNGRIGEDITEHCRHLHGVPLRVPVAGLEVRGEAFMPLSVFRARFADDFANPRNLAAGALKLVDAARTAEYGLKFFAYDARGEIGCRTEVEKRAFLLRHGFEPAPGATCTADDAFATFERLAQSRDTNDFETDGIVYKVDDLERYEAMGMTAHHPRGAIAFKYQGESGTSRLVDVLWNVSRSGTINPVAQIEPVSLSGVTVTRVSLHNLAIMEQLAGIPLAIGENPSSPLSAGATVLVTRRGGVIPHVESLVQGAEGLLAIPESCPSCGAATERRADFLAASHEENCTSQAIRALEYFAKVIDLRGFGPKLLEQLWDQNLVRTPTDLYRLTENGGDRLLELDRIGEKTIENLVRELDAHREIPLASFLEAMGIPGLGPQVATLIAQAYGGGHEGGAAEALGAIRGAEPSDLEKIDGIGPILATQITAGLREREDLIDDLLGQVRVTLPTAAPTPIAGENPVAGKSFVFTGALDTMTRDAAKSRVRALGGATPDSVTRATDFLVLGDKDYERFAAGWSSSKLKKAKAIAEEPGATLQILSETEFLRLVDA